MIQQWENPGFTPLLPSFLYSPFLVMQNWNSLLILGHALGWQEGQISVMIGEQESVGMVWLNIPGSAVTHLPTASTLKYATISFTVYKAFKEHFKMRLMGGKMWKKFTIIILISPVITLTLHGFLCVGVTKWLCYMH